MTFSLTLDCEVDDDQQIITVKLKHLNGSERLLKESPQSVINIKDKALRLFLPSSSFSSVHLRWPSLSHSNLPCLYICPLAVSPA